MLAFAQRELVGEETQDVYTDDPLNVPVDGFTFVGLVSLVDPPRANVEKAVVTVRSGSLALGRSRD